jgi:hypothetical protein
LADSGRPMIVLVASCGPCMATGTGRTTGNCNRSIGAFGGGKTSLHLARHRTAEALGIEFVSQNKLNDLGCETIVLPCVRGLQNSSSPIKGASHRPKEG